MSLSFVYTYIFKSTRGIKYLVSDYGESSIYVFDDLNLHGGVDYFDYRMKKLRHKSSFGSCLGPQSQMFLVFIL